MMHWSRLGSPLVAACHIILYSPACSTWTFMKATVKNKIEKHQHHQMETSVGLALRHRRWDWHGDDQSILLFRNDLLGTSWVYTMFSILCEPPGHLYKVQRQQTTTLWIHLTRNKVLVHRGLHSAARGMQAYFVVVVSSLSTALERLLSQRSQGRWATCGNLDHGIGHWNNNPRMYINLNNLVDACSWRTDFQPPYMHIVGHEQYS